MTIIHFRNTVDSNKTNPVRGATDFVTAMNQVFGKIDVTVILKGDASTFYAKFDVPDIDAMMDIKFGAALETLRDEKFFTYMAATEDPKVLDLFAQAEQQATKDESSSNEQKIIENESQLNENVYQIIWDSQKRTLALKTPVKTMEFQMTHAERYLLNPIIKNFAKNNASALQKDEVITLNLTEEEFNQAIDQIKKVAAKLNRFSPGNETLLEPHSEATTRESLGSPFPRTESLRSHQEEAPSTSAKQKLKKMTGQDDEEPDAPTP